jgi:hypothetical protein
MIVSHFRLLRALLGLITLLGWSCKPDQYLRGYFTPDQFAMQADWKYPGPNPNYKPSQRWLDSLRTLDDSLELKLFLGTWCSHSEKWVPRFMTIQHHLPLRQITIISMDTTKLDSLAWSRQYSVDSVPTFIFLDADGQERGRFFEKPRRRGLCRNLEYQLWTILRPSPNPGLKPNTQP